MFTHALASNPATNATTLKACFVYGHTHNPDVAAIAVANPNAPQDIVGRAATSPHPTVRAAWLKRPERTRDELVEAVQGSADPDIVKTAVERAWTDETLLCALAGLHQPNVSLAIIKKHVPQAAVHDLLVSLDWAADTLVGSEQASVRTFFLQHADHVHANAATITSCVATDIVITHPDTTADELRALFERHVKPLAEQPRTWTELQRHNKLALQMLQHPNIDRELVDTLDTHLTALKVTALSGWSFKATVKQARLNTEPHYNTTDLVSYVATNPNTGDVMATITDPRYQQVAATLTEAAVRNPHLTASTLAANSDTIYAHITDNEHDPVAQSIIDQHGDQTLIDILGSNGTDDDKLLAAQTAHDPTAATTAIITKRLAAHRCTITWAVEHGHITEQTIGTIPATALTILDETTQAAETILLIDRYLNRTLGSHPPAWELFLDRHTTWPGTLDELAHTALAATR